MIGSALLLPLADRLLLLDKDDCVASYLGDWTAINRCLRGCLCLVVIHWVATRSAHQLSQSRGRSLCTSLRYVETVHDYLALQMLERAASPPILH